MRADRLLSIVIIISQKGLVTAKELSEHFEVSLRTIYRDIEKIAEAGVPVAAIGGKGGGYYIMENYNINNLFLNRKDIAPLAAVMDNLKVLFGNNSRFNDVVLKFNTLLKDNDNDEYERFNIDMSHFSMEKELRECLFLANKAIENSRLLEFEYVNRKMDCSQRIVEPIQIEFSSGQWYIIGFCRIRKDYRKFKLVRVRNPKLGDNFTKEQISKEQLDEIFSNSYEKNSIAVTLRFSSKIGPQLSEYFSKDRIKSVGSDGYIVEDFLPYDEGLKKFILGFGEDCEVIAPKDFRNEIHSYLKKISNKYND